ncbi:uncharacterized protein LOC129957549 [Argiope bruennichi]|uniref:uncharacterized protein LOC129957549 n=1 Tax=Argiope bruennichi TaxID=94029 RepID=UPI002495053D|nr:uncharacterized protein LOC129957549 [Argiope bruennichi]XP_055925879.1 uncharacterized protein LOC129957549 [Argiope bruennichi]
MLRNRLAKSEKTIFQSMTMDEYFYPKTLEDLSLRRAAVVLCSCPNMYMFAARMKDSNKEEFEPAIHKVTTDIVATISLPLMLEQDLLGAMKAVSREIIKWVKFHENFLEQYDGVLSRLENLEHICWTRLGTVDYEKTAQVLIRNKKLSAEQCYKLACLYCFCQDLKELWKEVPYSYKKVFFKDNPLQIAQPRIVVFFTCLLRHRGYQVGLFLPEGQRDLSSIFEYMFEYVALQGYGTATQYFFHKLNVLDRLHIITRVALGVAKRRSFDRGFYLHEYQKYSDVLRFLMSNMTISEQRELRRRAPFQTLKCLLDWPSHSEFLRHAKYILRFPLLSKEKYSRLLFILAHNSSSGFNYPRTFRIFFLMSPKKYKNYTLTHYSHFLREFIRINDVVTVKFIFRHLNVKEKVKLLVNQSMGRNFIPALVTAGKWDFLRLFIRESQLANESKESLVAYFQLRFPEDRRSEWFREFVREIRTDQSGARYDRWASDCKRIFRRAVRKRRNEDHTEQPNKLLRAD